MNTYTLLKRAPLAMLVFQASAAIIPVSPGTGLQAAMNAANAGDTIQLSAGTYTSTSDAFQINKAIIVQGVSGTILQVASAASAGLNVNVSGVTVQNLAINGGAFGVSVLNVSSGTFKNLAINPNPNPTVAGHGFNVSGSSNILADTITIGTVTNTGSNGFNVDTSTSVTIQNSTVQSSPRGAYFTNATGGVLKNCTITAPSFEGVLINASSGMTIDTVTILNAATNGIYVKSGSTGATIRNSIVTQAGANGIIVEQSNSALVNGNTVTQAVAQNGIWFNGSSSGVIENNTVARASLNGIILAAFGNAPGTGSSNNNIVMGNQVLRTDSQHSAAIQLSDFNTVVANTFINAGAVSAADGVLVSGAQSNRIEKNTVTNFSNDGIVMTPYPDSSTPASQGFRASTGNLVADNVVTGSSTTRTGIWVNDASNGTYVSGNTESIAAEGGITIFNASSNLIKGNSASQNAQAGIFVWNTDHAFPQPADNILQNNYSFNNPSNGEVLLRGANRTDFAYNYLSVANQSLTVGIGIASDSGTASGGSSATELYRNIVTNTNFPNYISSDTTATAYFQNRYFFPPNGFNFTPPGADIKWDASVFIGGNYWSNFTGASGNPSRGTPYISFINGSNNQLAGYSDRYPYANEDLGLNHSVTVMQPVAGSVYAPGSIKTLLWRTQGCVLVDLSYAGGASGVIAQNYPDTGYYVWTVPALAPAANYSIVVSCKNSAGAALNTSGSSGAFTIATSGLLAMSPGADQMTNASSTLRVSWRRTGVVAGVDVFLQTADGGGLSQLASNVTADYVDITLPAVSTSRGKIVIRATANNAIQDSNDGYFTIRGTTPGFTNPSSATTFLLGSIVDLEWVSPQGSQYVDLELFDTNTNQFRTIYANIRDFVLNIPDRSRYTYFVPERWMTNAYFRLTFKDITGNAISTVNSPSINFFYTTSTATLIPFYRLYLDLTKEHLLTTDANEYAVLGTRGWTQESNTFPPDQILNGNYVIHGVNAQPFYRVYYGPTLQHLWTIGRNEYFTLREIGGYSAEGVVGYVFPSQVTGTTALYRLSHKTLPIHLWTDGLNEYNVLSAPGGGWTGEGASSYLYCAPGDTQHPGCVSTLPPQSTSSADFPISSQVSAPALENHTYAWLQAARSRPGSQVPPFLIHVMNNASFQEGFVAPGEVVSLVGARIGPSNAALQQLVLGRPIPTDLANVSVLFDGVPAPLLYASQNEVRAIVPRSVSGKEKVTVQMEVDGDKANPFEIKVAAAMPGLYTTDGSGSGQAAALNPDESKNSALNPAAHGSVITLYLTGQGHSEPELADGEMPSPRELPKAVHHVALTFGGVSADALEAKAVAGLPGVLEVKARIPMDAPAGSSVPVVVTVGDAQTQAAVTIAVK